MIEKMSKITLLVDEGRSKKTLKTLRKLGVLHVKPLRNQPSGDMTAIETQLENAKKTLSLLGETKDIKQKFKGKAESIIQHILDVDIKRSELSREQDSLNEAHRWYDKWGQVSLTYLQDLKADRYYLKLYQLSRADWQLLKENENVFVLSETKTNVQVAFITRNEDEVLDSHPVIVPEISYETVTTRGNEIVKELTEIQSDINEHKCHVDLINKYINTLKKEFQFAQVVNGLGLEENIAYLQGYVPAEEAGKIEQAAQKNSWGFVEEEPGLSDNPPTKLKNAKWIQIIQSIFDFIGTVPGYREKDISIYFLIFFVIFVAMIIGDAGYGSIFLLLAIFASIKMKKSGKKIPQYLILVYVLSITTIAWGTITGNWFGSVEIANIPFFKSLIIPQITSFPELFPGMTMNPGDKVMLICFILAVIQLGLASILNFINNLPKLKALEHVGWFSMTVGLFTLVLNLVLEMDLPSFAMPLIGGGFAFIVLFGQQEPGKNFFKGIAAGLGGAFNTFLSAISSFSNIISYIRLFAVGMASVAIASSFNDIAASMGEGPLIIAAVIVLLIGHGLNIIMGLLSVIVHGIRLNMLEFSGQLGLEWTGYKYEPFKEK